MLTQTSVSALEFESPGLIWKVINLDRGGSYGGNQASLLWALPIFPLPSRRLFSEGDSACPDGKGIQSLRFLFGRFYPGRWERVSWDQALGEVAQNLRILRNEYGPETLAFTHGTYRTYNCDGWRFFNLFGSLNMCGASNVCMCPTQAVESLRLSFSS